MKKQFLTNVRLLIALVVLFGLTIAYIPAGAQDQLEADTSDQDIEALYRAQIEAFNNGDLEGAMAFYAEDAIGVYLPPPPDVDPIVAGKEAMRTANATMMANKPHIVYTDFHVTGNTATFRTITTDDFLKSIGVNYLEFSGTVIMRNGLIVVETSLMDKESQDRLEAAIKLQTNKEIVARFYDEVFSQGNMAVADEIVDPTFDAIFTGEKNFAKSSDGLEKLKEGITGFRKSFPDYKIEVSDMVAEGDIVVANIKGTGTYAGGFEDLGVPASAIGKKVIFYGTDYTRVVNGKMVEAWGTHDDLPWFQQMDMELMPASK